MEAIGLTVWKNRASLFWVWYA